MKTYTLGAEEIRGYLVDCILRFKTARKAPTVWCSITESGKSLMPEIRSLSKIHNRKKYSKMEVVHLDIESKGASEKLVFSENPKARFANKSVLILDGAIHSGRNMSRCANEVLKYKPSALSSYALVIKQSSQFVPTLWSIMIDDTDRAYFILDKIPNNRLNAGKTRPQALVQLRLLGEEHLKRPQVTSSVPSMNRQTWGDKYFQMIATSDEYRTYVLEDMAQIIGYLTVELRDSDSFALRINLQVSGF